MIAEYAKPAREFDLARNDPEFFVEENTVYISDQRIHVGGQPRKESLPSPSDMIALSYKRLFTLTRSFHPQFRFRSAITSTKPAIIHELTFQSEYLYTFVDLFVYIHRPLLLTFFSPQLFSSFRSVYFILGRFNRLKL